MNPCDGTCGINAICNVINHIPVCTCAEGYTGDAFSYCNPIPPPAADEEIVQDRCNPSPCGGNAICNDGSCTCLPEFHGDPYSGCRPECVLNSDCARERACLRSKCADPCPGVCGQNALCAVINHVPMCSCPTGMEGDAYTICRPVVHEPINVNPCRPSPCGPNSQCRESNGQAVCTCLAGYYGVPPTCRPECVVNSDCARNRACANQKCIDPCPGACGVNAQCRVVNHNPICSCINRYTGNPLVNCHPIGKDRLLVLFWLVMTPPVDL